MLSDNRKITLRQLQILIMLDALGIGVIVLPRRAAEYAMQDGWLIVIGLTMLALLFGWLTTSIASIFPADSFITYTSRLLTKPLAVLLGAGLLFKFIACAGLELRLFIGIIRSILLRNTPGPVVAAVMLLIGLYAAVKGIETRARAGEILFWAIILPLLLLLIIALFDIDFSNLKPVLVTPPENLAAGTLMLGFVFTGLEGLLLVFPYLNNPEKGRTAVLRGIAITGGLIVLITVITTAKFGPHDLLIQPWPVLRLLDTLKIPGSFIERQDALTLSCLILSMFAFTGASLFYSAVLSRDMTGRGTHTIHSCVCALLVFGVCMLPLDTERIYRWLDGLYITFGVFYMAVLPLLLLLTAKLRTKPSKDEYA